jgi:quinol monooxygenase YgiN
MQLIEFSTSQPGEVQRLSEQWRADTEDKRTVRRTLTCLDRDQPNRFMVIVEFDSYEAAMENSNLEETEDFAEALAKLVDGPPVFRNLDVMMEYDD